MRLLLDTHAWLWQLLAPDNLSQTAASALVDPENDFFLSPISVWETLLLAQRGRVELQPNPEAWVREALRLSPTAMAPLTHEIAIRSADLPGFDVRDPADRFLVATCLVDDLTLVTADQHIRGYDAVETLW